MENAIKCEVIDETSGEQNSVLVPESYSVNTAMQFINTKLDQFAVDTEADNQQSMEISSGLEEESHDRVQSLFAPFNHRMRPDLEYIRLESEISARDQKAVTKLINDRYKLIMENSVRRKEKEQKDKIRFSQIPQKVDSENVIKITPLSHENIEETAQLIHNMHITPVSLSEDKSKEFSDDHLEKIYWHNGLNRFIKLDYLEINTKANISSFDNLKAVTQDHEYRVEDALRQIRNDAFRQMRNEKEDGEKRITFSQVYQKLGSAKYKKDSQIFCDDNEFIGSSFEELLDGKSGGFYEV